MSYTNDMPTVQQASRTDAGLATELRLSVMRLRRRLANERQPDNELSLGAMAVLGCLFRDGEMTVGALATWEQVQPPSMTRTVNCLEDGGYVARRPHETDGRQVVVDLTDRGRETLLADRRPPRRLAGPAAARAHPRRARRPPQGRPDPRQPRPEGLIPTT